MSKRSKIIILCLNTLLCALISVCTGFFMQGWGTLIKVIFYSVAGVGFVAGVTLFCIKKEQFFKGYLKTQTLYKGVFVLVACVAATVGVVALISRLCGLENYPSDAEKIDKLVEIIQGLGVWGYFVYFLIQVLQVVILPIPAAVCYVPGSLIWGPIISTIIASLGVIVGSIICYVIGKYCGKPVVVWIAGKETTEKYTAYLSKRGKILFLLMQLLPFFPDDVLCLVVGLTGMNFVFFLVTIILIRPIVIAAYCFFGSGTIIPFSGWGIPVWIAVFAFCIVLAVLSFKYNDKIEQGLLKIIKGKNKKSKVKDASCGDNADEVGKDNSFTPATLSNGSQELTDSQIAQEYNSEEDKSDS